MNAWRTVMVLAVCWGAVSLSARPGLAAEPSPEEAPAVSLPVTAEEHLALARSYAEKAATWRKEAEHHRQLAAAYQRARLDPKGTRIHAAAEIEKHCAKIAMGAEKLAKDAEDTANYHRLRADELM